MTENGEERGRGQSLLAIGEAMGEPPKPAGASRLAAAIAQVRAERGMAPPRQPPQSARSPEAQPEPDSASQDGPRTATGVSPLLLALAGDDAPPRAAAGAPAPTAAEDWPRERSAGAVPPLLAKASDWPESRPARPAPKPEPEPATEPPAATAEDELDAGDDDTTTPSPVAAAVAAVKAVHARKVARPEPAPVPGDRPAGAAASEEKLPFPDPEPLPPAQPGDAFWDDAARVLGLGDEPPQPPRTAGAPATIRSGTGRLPLAGAAPIGIAAALRGSTRLILSATVAGAVLGGAWALLTPRTYTSTAELITDAQQPAMSDEALRAIVEDQLRVLRSQSMLTEVVARLELADDPEFDGTADGMSLSTLARIISGEAGNADPERRRSIAEQNLSRSLAIARDGASSAIDIAATTQDAEKSARIANTVADIFLAGEGLGEPKAGVRVLGQAPASEPAAAPARPAEATRIISRATPALASNPPSRLSIILKGLALGLFAGLGLAMLRVLRDRFGASQPAEELASAPVLGRLATGGSPGMPGTLPARAQPRPRAAEAAATSQPIQPAPEPQTVAHSAPPEDSTMRRAPDRRFHDPRSAAPYDQYPDRYRPAPLSESRPLAGYAPSERHGHTAYGSAYADEGAPLPSGSSWRRPADHAPGTREWEQTRHAGRQHMLYPRHQPMQAEPQGHDPSVSPSWRAHSSRPPEPDHLPYGESPYDAHGERGWTHGRESRLPAGDPRRGQRAAPAYGPGNINADAYDPRYGDGASYPYSQAPADYGQRDDFHGDRRSSAYVGGEPPRETERYWRDPPRQSDPSIDEIRATLRECREAIRDLSDRRTRRRYF